MKPHSALVRVTHWVNAASFVALLVSGVAILLVHPRLYWGEAGTFGTPSLIDLPLPLVLEGQNGWGRSLHFLSAWISVLTGTIYVLAALASKHPPGDRDLAYPPVQRLTYVMVVTLLFPAMIWTGLAMSPSVTSAFPVLATLLGGQQSARTVHFFVAAALALFLLGHVAMVAVSGFRERMRGMITGRRTLGAERA